MSKRLAYCAGFFDGEGCICITHWKQNGYDGFSASISIGQKSKDILKTFQHIFGGNKRLYKQRLKTGTYYHWYIRNISEIKSFLLRLFTYFRYKKQQALWMLDFIRYKERIKNFRFTDIQRLTFEFYYIVLKDLKKSQ